MNSSAYDLIVVGAGVVGTFHAYFAAKSGARVLLLERNPAPNEATVRNFGMVATTTISTGGDWDQYARATGKIYQQLEQEIEEDLSLRKCGSLYLVETDQEDQLIREFADLADSLDKSAEYLDQQSLLEAYPFAKADYVRGGLLLPDDMNVDPRRFIHILLRHIQATDLLEYRPNTCIVKAESHADHCSFSDGSGQVYTAQKGLICNGVEYRMLFPELFQASPLKICKLQMLLTDPQTRVRLPHNILSGLTLRRYPAFAACPSFDTFMASPFDEIYKKWGIHLLFKQADDGSVIIGDSHEYFSLKDRDTVSFDLLAEINDAILEYGKRMIDLDTWRIQHSWNGYYLNHPTDNIFTQDLSEHLHIATGIGGKGMSTGAGFAQHNISHVLE